MKNMVTTTFKILAIILLVNLLTNIDLQSQSYRQVGGYEETEHRYPGNIEKIKRTYSGQLYNQSETFIFINTSQNPNSQVTPTNCYVTGRYVWGSFDGNGNFYFTRYVKFDSNPWQTPHSVITDVQNFQGVDWHLPDTRIDNTYKSTGNSSYWSYCRTTWRLVNPQLKEYYFPFQYAVANPDNSTQWAWTGFKVGGLDHRDIVVRWEDLRLGAGVPIGTPNVNILPPATGPYYQFMTPTSTDVLFPPLYEGTSGTYYLPAIPTPHFIMETYLTNDIWRP